jgi:antitoxin component YwqK of YwqJK toxin-antitoxin module
MRLYLILFLLIPCCTLNAQYYNGRVRIDSADRSYIFQITDDNRPTKRYTYYYTFKSGYIHKTQGSYYGKLLHGDFKVVDTRRNLLEEGKFRKGIKKGLWRTWYEDGTLKSTWRRRYWFIGNAYNVSEYDAQGNVTKTGYVRKGAFTGSQVEWKGDNAVMVRYKNGTMISDTTK